MYHPLSDVPLIWFEGFSNKTTHIKWHHMSIIICQWVRTVGFKRTGLSRVLGWFTIIEELALGLQTSPTQLMIRVKDKTNNFESVKYKVHFGFNVICV